MSEFRISSRPPRQTAQAADAARQRFFQLLKIGAAASVAATAVMLLMLHFTDDQLSLPALAAIAVSTAGTLMMAAVLVGLSFLSHANGTDDKVHEFDLQMSADESSDGHSAGSAERG